MSKKSKPSITASNTKHTKVTYLPDYEKFGMQKLDEQHFKMLYKRTVDLAGINPDIKFYFNKEQIKVKKIEDYIKFYIDEPMIEENDGWVVGISNSENGFQTVSFCNGVDTYDNGTHVDYILNQIITRVREYINKKHKIDVKPSEIKNHLFLFLNAVVVNPAFNSQTKEKLITEQKDFGYEFVLSDKFINRIIKSEIVQSILDWYQQKKAADDNKELRKLNNLLGTKKVEGLVDANNKDRSNCVLYIYEGLSASGFMRSIRNPATDGFFCLRGKFMNTSEIDFKKISENKEAINLLGAIGLKLGQKITREDLRFSEILIASDMDTDGDSITALMINFFSMWEELFDWGIIHRFITPLLVAKKGKERKYFFEQAEFDKWQKTAESKRYDEILYKKGLGSLQKEEMQDMLLSPNKLKITKDNLSKEKLDIWFGKDSEPRKIELLK